MTRFSSTPRTSVWSVDRTNEQRVSLSEARDAAERDAIKAAVAQSLGSITRAAELLQISRVSLYRLMEKHGITPPGQKDR
ncbi:helix-turn-helix domain-containing protein [Acidithiobacillus sp. AMEEHan]|uniref:helix-turn-helix domain-containing protein n=1 Tax=Acidithiobacillus sp. AMEEHan TaxID=2994951 RepID=UPI0027E49550|nr:helix-turn-helix domain-containing protein [Acidithiobacillus sp. AMEEHan]